MERIKRGMTYKEFLEKKEQAFKEECKIQFKPQFDYALMSNLLDYFYEEVSPKTYNQFLYDYGYSAEDYVKCMTEMRKKVV
jgi:peptide methionine sulfoxide reductase MsrA